MELNMKIKMFFSFVYIYLQFGEKLLEAKSPAILRQCHVQDFR